MNYLAAPSSSLAMQSSASEVEGQNEGNCVDPFDPAFSCANQPGHVVPSGTYSEFLGLVNNPPCASQAKVHLRLDPRQEGGND